MVGKENEKQERKKHGLRNFFKFKKIFLDGRVIIILVLKK